MTKGRQALAVAISFCFLFILATGCAYDKKEVITPACHVADTVTYTVNIEPIIRTHCYLCHDPSGSFISGIALNSYAGLKTYAQNGLLYKVISHASGYPPMPQGADKLDDCTIATIKKWIDIGTPEN